MAEKKRKHKVLESTGTDADIQRISEEAYRNSGIAESNRQQGIQNARRVQQQRESRTGSRLPSSEPKKRRSNGVELLQKASDALKGIDRLASTEAEMTFGKPYDPKATERGRLGNTLAAGGKGWTAGQANALGFLLDPTDDGSMSDLEMELDPTGAGKKLGENRVADFLNRLRGKASESLYGTANRLSDEAAESEEQAKKGLGKVGQILVDVGIAGTQLAADATIGRLTGAGMTTMGTRTFGQSAREALDNGANQQQAFNYGASSAAVEMLTEKLFDVGKIFGKGAGDELIEKAVEKWAKTDAGRSAIRTFFATLTESGEEAASDLVNPIIRQFYDSDAVKETYGTAEGRRQLASDIGRDALVGGILGGLGTVATGQNRAANAQIRANETARQQAAENARLADAAARTQAQNEALASNTMQTGTADAEAAAALERNRARANRPQAAQALSRVFNGQQITEAEATAILNDTELMAQMLNAVGMPAENGNVRTAFIRMMAENGTPLFGEAQNAAESPVTNAEPEQGNLTEEPAEANTSQGTAQSTNGIAFTGDSGTRYTQQQADALSRLTNDALINYAESSYPLPLNQLGLDAETQQALREAGLTYVNEDSDTPYETLHDHVVFDERSRRRTESRAAAEAAPAQPRSDAEVMREAAAEAARAEQRQRASQRQRELYASNIMQTGTADAEAAQVLAGNQERIRQAAEQQAIRAARPQTAQALSRVFNGQQITAAEATAILNDTELMAQMLNAVGMPAENGNVRTAFIRMMAENGTPIIQTAENAAESPVTNAAAQQGNLAAEPQTFAAERETGQNGGITVYRGYNRSDNPLENNLAQTLDIYDVLGIGSPRKDVERIPLSYYTESAEDAGRYAGMDQSLYDSLVERAKLDYNGLLMRGTEPPEGRDTWIQRRAAESYKVLTGRSAPGKGEVRSHTIYPQKTLDLTGLGEKATPDDVYRTISEQTGVDDRTLDSKLILSNISEGEPFDVFRILRNEPGVNTGSAMLSILRDNGFDSVRYSESGTNHYAMIENPAPPQASADTEKTETAPAEDAQGQNEAQTRSGSAETHIDNRGADEIRKTSVKAFQYEHPELREHFVNIAQQLQQDAAESVSNGPMALRKGGTRIQKSKGLAVLMERTGLSRNKLVTVLQNIIDDHGAENNADAKRVELALDYLMSQHPDYRDEAYRQKKGNLEGGTPVGSYEEYLKQNELSIELGEVTEEQVRREWEQMQAERNAAAESAPAQPQRDTSLPEGHGAMSAQFPYREAPSQTHSADSIFTEEERQNVEGLRPEDLQHQVRTNADVDYHAQERLESDYEGEKADLYRDDKEWDVVDIATAWQILAEETRAARESGDWSEVVRLRKIYRDKASNWGQVGHEMSRHAHTAEDIISDAAEQLDDIGDLPPDEFNETMNQIDEFANEWENTNPEHPEGLLDLIRRLNAARRTGGLFTPERTGNTLNRTLEAVIQQEGGFDYLRQIAEQQIRNLANDRAPLSPIEAATSIRYMSMLSKLTTIMRNLVGNNVFDPIESLSGNVAMLPDMLMSLVTHRRTTAGDASWFSAAKRRGSIEGMQRAYIAAALDADVDGGMNRWEQRNGRTFKMQSNPFFRFLSTIEKWQQYALTVTDEFQKGGIEAEAERQRQRLIDRGLLGADELQGWAEQTARQRTFQNDGRVSDLMLGARNLLNSAGTINDRRGGSFGLGDALIPFARVPGNVVGQFLNYTPAGLVRGLTNMTNIMLQAINGEVAAEQQAQAARDIGRGLNGSALLAGFAYLAAQGLLNVADGGDTDDEKDLAKLEQSEGVTGTQWNLSATLRALRGEGAYWQDGDDLMSIGFLEPINGIMALAALVADSDELNARTLANSTAAAAMQSIADLPAMSSLTNIINNYKYAEGDTADKLGMAGAQLVGSTISSFVPNALSGIAQGMDEGTVRQTYGSDREGLAGVADETWNTIKSKIPGARSTLPAALDNLGRERQTTATPLQNWLNSNLLPGSLTQYSTDRVSQEIERMAENGAPVPNRSAEKSFTQDGQKYELNVGQQRAYQKAYGNTVRNGVSLLLQSSEYLNMSKGDRAAVIDSVLDYAREVARSSVKPAYEMNSAAAKADEAADELGISPVEYLLMAAGVSKYNEDGKGNIKNDELEDALNALYDDDDEMKSTLWTFYGRSDKTNPWK